MTLLPFSGPIKSLRVSNNSVVNNLTGGLINNAITTGVNIAFNSDKVGPSDVLSGVISPGILTSANEGISRFLTNEIVNSGALGPLGPLGVDLAATAIGNLSQDLLKVFPQFKPRSEVSRWFPGAGDEPKSSYGGEKRNSSVFSEGLPGSTDLVFMIKRVSNGAQEQAQTEVSSTSPGTGVSSPSPSPASGSVFPNGAQSPASNPISGSSSSPVTSNSGSLSGTPIAITVSPFEQPAPEETRQAESLPQETTGNNSQTPPEGVKAAEEGVWKFICSPKDITWDTSVQVNRVEVFGSNTPPVTVGTRGMRELSLSNSIVEGFSRGVTVEKKVIDLENLTKLSLENGKFIVPVFHVIAGEKKYGGDDGGFFVIKEIKVKEEMRDTKGNTTRATVDVSFTQVPTYQVSFERDIASRSATGARTALTKVSDRVDSNLNNRT